ncbi:unnamed protein product [Protopolystoma xenopodis]|uniref:Uncharacterized protein n=1 Tax=Protopolystoma xenopodis TaxID=117903 RepID=A0A448WQX1_9PLAT|nr:unnamed protein product [Protopolystoma xenopodis]
MGLESSTVVTADLTTPTDVMLSACVAGAIGRTEARRSHSEGSKSEIKDCPTGDMLHEPSEPPRPSGLTDGQSGGMYPDQVLAGIYDTVSGPDLLPGPSDELASGHLGAATAAVSSFSIDDRMLTATDDGLLKMEATEDRLVEPGIGGSGGGCGGNGSSSGGGGGGGGSGSVGGGGGGGGGNGSTGEGSGSYEGVTRTDSDGQSGTALSLRPVVFDENAPRLEAVGFEAVASSAQTASVVERQQVACVAVPTSSVKSNLPTAVSMSTPTSRSSGQGCTRRGGIERLCDTLKASVQSLAAFGGGLGDRVAAVTAISSNSRHQHSAGHMVMPTVATAGGHAGFGRWSRLFQPIEENDTTAACELSGCDRAKLRSTFEGNERGHIL